ncbi:CHAP domain-containing protein [Solirubrobacter soli]|uniref:CHAP domain-containing protein n=1 Tax=Solirubrobacter soli TaxID=363832 RepID=UPI00047F8C78|nr:CHAP domain-containing protein [Solirubrobacter soli]
MPTVLRRPSVVCVLLGVGFLVTSAAPARAADGVSIRTNDSSKRLVASKRARLVAEVPGRTYCRLRLTHAGAPTASSSVRKAVAGIARFTWRVGGGVANGRWKATVSCASNPRSLARGNGRSATITLRATHGGRHGRAVRGRVGVVFLIAPEEADGRGAGAATYQRKGTLLIRGGDWLSGQGVDVFSNGNPNVDGYSGVYQCVELVKRLLKARGWSTPFYGDAHQYLDHAPGEFFDKHRGGDGYRPVPGDVLVWGGGLGGWGHVAIVEGVNGGSVFFVEQNASATGRGSLPIDAAGNVAKRGSASSYFIGTLHAKKNTLGQAPPAPTGPKPSDYAGHIVQWDGDRAGQKAAWLVGPDLKRRWIPTTEIYGCLKDAGHPGPDVLSGAMLDQLPDLNGEWATCTRPTPTVTPTPSTPTPVTPTVTPTPTPPTTPVPQPWVNLAKGASAQGRSGCSSAACKMMVVSFGNFSPGPHTVTCRAGNGDEGGWISYTRSGSSDSYAYCYYGYPGRSVWVTVDGIGSNTVVW